MTIAQSLNVLTTVGQKEKGSHSISVLILNTLVLAKALDIRQLTLVFNPMSEITLGETTGFGSEFGEFLISLMS